jgi:3-hydroxyisobutyrate dehydrogenase
VSEHLNRIGVVGLGLIGAGVSRALHRSGFAVVGSDVRPEAVQQLDGIVTPTPSASAVADSAEIVLIAVMTDGQLREVLDGSNGVLAATQPPRVVVVLTTATINTVRWAAVACESRGIALLDCGVSGGAGGLERGAMAAMVGGDDEAFALARPALAAFANPVVHMGGVGMGMAAKLARNVIVYADWFVAWEASRLAIAAGVELAAFVEVVEASDRWVGSHMYLAKQGIGLGGGANAAAPQGSVVAEYARKDLAAALELADELGVKLPGARLTASQFDAVAGLGQVEEESG